jgi:hypothetical protein
MGCNRNSQMLQRHGLTRPEDATWASLVTSIATPPQQVASSTTNNSNATVNRQPTTNNQHKI